jgi:Glu-tRNA(Gln) amidotransferase subunit E-like FAD-binding protein
VSGPTTARAIPAAPVPHLDDERLTMSTQSTAQPDTFAASAERLADERVRIDALIAAGAAAARRDDPMRELVDEPLEAMEAFGAAVEELRRRHYPRAHRLVVVEDSAYLASATMRSVRQVWSREQARP